MRRVFCSGQTWIFFFWLSVYSSHRLNSFSADPGGGGGGGGREGGREGGRVIGNALHSGQNVFYTHVQEQEIHRSAAH